MKFQTTTLQLDFPSHSVLTSPFASVRIVLFLVGLVEMSNLGYKWIVWICIRHHWADGKENLWDSQSRWPLIFQNVKTDTSIRVDIAVINSCRKCHFRWLEWIVSWEANVEEKDSSCVWRIIWTHDCRLPGELVFLIKGASRTVSWRVLSKIDEFFLDSFECHC